MASSKFEELVEKKKLEREALEKASQPASTEEVFDDELVPDAKDVQLSEAQLTQDALVNSIPLIDAYNRLTPYNAGRVRPGQTESIKLRCPNPAHSDEEPSYSINTNKNTGKCFVCGVGYDVKDIAAFSLGFNHPDYKTNGQFGEVMDHLASSFGYHVERTLGGQEVFWRDAPEETEVAVETAAALAVVPPPPVETPDLSDSGTSNATVTELYDGDDFEILLPSLDWRTIVPGTDTFLDKYMGACIKDEVPEEYHFFNALLALGFACGREVTLHSKLPVYGNLFLCHLGKSGAGKSTSTRHLRQLLKRVYPYKHSDPASKGVVFTTPSSAEILIDSFSKPITDPVNPKQIVSYASVRGLIDFNELSGLIGRASRVGNLIKPIMMDFFDMNDEVRSQSRGSGTVIAQDAFASCLTTAQPAALRDLLRESDDASGFLNRWVFIGGTPKERTIMGTGDIDLSEAIDSLEKIKGWCGSFLNRDKVRWEDDAIAAMQEFFNELVYPLAKRNDTNLFVRLDLLCLKLCLLFSVNKHERNVTVETVETVKRMYSYLVACYGIPADQIGNSLENELTEAIIYQMKRLGGKEGATVNAIAKALKRRKYPKELILRNIKALIELGFVEERVGKPGNVGRPTKRYAYVA